ncbi:VOC family protein [Arthrobacter deserti]|uniref:VOC family protein n=1 Tax=Arthrobacter deserti TaxID=1742687 RepID=A0ABX1JR97_9MICC|nr:VOC family protein [Arthrobacter deserti]
MPQPLKSSSRPNCVVWVGAAGITAQITDRSFYKEPHAPRRGSTGSLRARPQAGRRRILFQDVPEPKTVKDRLHLDVRLDGEDKDAVRSRLQARGAVFLHEGRQGPRSWYTTADPEGNEFCIG